ncbi:hypothetical protein [Streptomyces sp. 2314.4]|uniref:hypothetical protein n=1 Tax=Streptomyces sp. 2314.4 TaxID=1881025 RepID=UPI0008963E51|nr:hypothetical protein [Streptomyces sp. 2314.4]SEC13011.1 hypothetical protein SAMN05428943_1089 [Streptomyces sp. 2314.4]
MSDESALTAADTVISAAWGHPVDKLHDYLREGRAHDPALVAVLRVRTALVIDDSDIAVQRERIRRLTRQGHVPLHHDLKQLSSSSTELLTAHAESQARLHAIRSIIDVYPEGHLAEGLARSLDHSAAARAEAARARSSTPLATPPTGPRSSGHMAVVGTRDEVRSARR